eukprot:2715017-Rhodomonas_salina.1
MSVPGAAYRGRRCIEATWYRDNGYPHISSSAIAIDYDPMPYLPPSEAATGTPVPACAISVRSEEVVALGFSLGGLNLGKLGCDLRVSVSSFGLRVLGFGYYASK